MLYNLCIAGVGVALYIFLVWRMTTWYDQKKIHWITRDVVVLSSATFCFGFAIHIFTVQDDFSSIYYAVSYMDSFTFIIFTTKVRSLLRSKRSFMLSPILYSLKTMAKKTNFAIFICIFNSKLIDTLVR